MTRDQIAKRVRDNLNDAGIVYYSVDDINESIQDAYDEIAVYSECIEKNTTLPFVADTTYYDLSVLIPDYYRVIRIFSSVINDFIYTSSDRNQLGFRQDWELANYSSRDFIILGSKYIGFPGRTSTPDNKTFKIWYKAQAGKLTGNITPLINPNFQILLELYSTADLLEQNQEYTKASVYWDQYEPKLEEYKQKIQLLSRSDREFSRGYGYGRARYSQEGYGDNY